MLFLRTFRLTLMTVVIGWPSLVTADAASGTDINDTLKNNGSGGGSRLLFEHPAEPSDGTNITKISDVLLKYTDAIEFLNGTSNSSLSNSTDTGSGNHTDAATETDPPSTVNSTGSSASPLPTTIIAEAQNNETTTFSTAMTTPEIADSDAVSCEHSGRQFDGSSFVGGMVLAVGSLAIVAFLREFYRARMEHEYHSL